MQYTTKFNIKQNNHPLFYQDFKDTFVCNTQLATPRCRWLTGCFIRISKILLYAIHNSGTHSIYAEAVVLSGFQRYFCMQYTTTESATTKDDTLFYQDFKDTFVCNTQLNDKAFAEKRGCFIRISKILLYAIHNSTAYTNTTPTVVLSGFQRYFCMQYTTPCSGRSLP